MKKMNNYEFCMNWYGGLTEEIFLTAMRNNDASKIFRFSEKYGDCFCLIEENKNEPYYRAIAILENGHMAIEVDFWMNEDLEPVIDFSMYRQEGNDKDWCNGWEADGFYYDVIDDTLITDFTKDDWEEQLEKEMFNKLDKYCKAKGYDYTKPIKYY